MADDNDDECPELVQDDGEKIPVTIITGYLGKITLSFVCLIRIQLIVFSLYVIDCIYQTSAMCSAIIQLMVLQS